MYQLSCSFVQFKEENAKKKYCSSLSIQLFYGLLHKSAIAKWIHLQKSNLSKFHISKLSFNDIKNMI